jgi:thiamine kinase-like enzyme
MNLIELAQGLSGTSDAKFYSSLALVRSIPEASRCKLIELLLTNLNSSVALAEFKKGNRLTAVLQSISLDAEAWNTIVRDASGLAPGLRNTLAQHLPPRHRRLLSGREASGRIAQIDVDITPAKEVAQENRDLEGNLRDVDSSTVVILSKGPTHSAIRKRLEAADFVVLVWDSVAKLRSDLAAGAGDICAFMLESTVLSELNEDEQRTLLAEVAAFSTFAWLRVDSRGLLLSVGEVEKTIEHARAGFGHVAARSLLISSSGFGSLDLEYIERCRGALTTHRMVAFVPGELQSDQPRLLIAAAKDYADEEYFQSDIKIETLETTFFRAGASSASTALIRINRHGPPIVAKLASREQILDEIRRFREFIQPWDNQLRPRVYLHGGASLILFALLRASVASEDPAPVLAECLQEAWNAEVFSPNDNSHARTETFLTEALRSTANLLSSLNRRTAPVNSTPVVDLTAGNALLESLETRCITWGFDEAFRSSRRKASSRFALYAGSAVTHGDFHLKNVLVRGTNDVHLIDYAAAGPGHPAVDLVRFEMALLLGVARQVAPESPSIEIQKALSVDRASLDEMADRFPDFFACRLNRVVMAGCVTARDQALNVLESYGAGYDDYLAAKCVLAWQSLLLHDRQTAMARSVIAALQPTLECWPT